MTKKVINQSEWIKCAECESDDVELEHWGGSDYRPKVKCNDCGAGGYFD